MTDTATEKAQPAKRATTKTSRATSKKPTAAQVKAAQQKKAEEVSAKLAGMLDQNLEQAGTPAKTRQPKEKQPLAKGEYEMMLPATPSKDDEEPPMIAVRFFKPKNWTVATSARNARQWHVVDLDRLDTHRTLCTLPTDLWTGGMRQEDRKKVPITCRWCLARMIECGAVTDAQNESVKTKWAAEKKANLAAAKKQAATTTAAATAEPEKAKPVRKPRTKKAEPTTPQAEVAA